jgi:hypothetical protein
MIKYDLSFAWGCRELPLIERIRKTLKKQPFYILGGLLNMVLLSLLVWTVINAWLT